MNMASGLCLLGRGDRRHAVYATTHILFAALGGATAGLAFGAIGFSLPTDLRTACAAAGVALAASLAIRPPANRGAGLRRQVARRLRGQPRPTLTYALWGAELGSGLSTLIPYSAFVLVLAVELLSGPLLGAAAGLSFGVARQGIAVIAATRITSPAQIAALLPRFAAQARLANLVVCLAGTTAVVTELAR